MNTGEVNPAPPRTLRSRLAASSPAAVEPLSTRIDEFARGASEWTAERSRREFIQLRGASLALAGVSGCNRPPHKEIVPYPSPPEAGFDVEALYYASALPLPRSVF